MILDIHQEIINFGNKKKIEDAKFIKKTLVNIILNKLFKILPLIK